jgi:hypothetical protein
LNVSPADFSIAIWLVSSVESTVKEQGPHLGS